jgi:hypothetical protein
MSRTDLSHPGTDRLKCFVRGGVLPSPEVRDIVRHLLTGCVQCIEVTHWHLRGEKHHPFEDVLAADLSDEEPLWGHRGSRAL